MTIQRLSKPYGSHPGTDANWTGRTQRESKWSGGNWAPNSHRIPVVGWIGAAIFVAVLFVAIPVIGHITGF